MDNGGPKKKPEKDACAPAHMYTYAWMSGPAGWLGDWLAGWLADWLACWPLLAGRLASRLSR